MIALGVFATFGIVLGISTGSILFVIGFMVIGYWICAFADDQEWTNVVLLIIGMILFVSMSATICILITNAMTRVQI